MIDRSCWQQTLLVHLLKPGCFVTYLLIECWGSDVLGIWSHITNSLINSTQILVTIVFCVPLLGSQLLWNSMTQNCSDVRGTSGDSLKYDMPVQTGWERESMSERHIYTHRHTHTHTHTHSSETLRCKWSSHLERGPCCLSWLLQDQRSTMQPIPSQASDPWNYKRNRSFKSLNSGMICYSARDK